MPANQSQRPKFYEEQYLGAADLTAAVDYSRIRQAQHALGAHTWGIAIGLQLKEKDTPAGGGVEVFIQPGYAWDGFGRPIVVLAPYKIPAELFKSIPFANLPAGQLIKVWLRYDESATQRARPGFEVCDIADQFSRVQETFRVEIGDRPNHADRHDAISVASYVVDAQETLRKLDPNDPLLYDESVPYQNFPEASQKTRWLIPLGAVLWQPNSDPNQPGAYAKRTPDDLKFSRSLRRYIGVVAEAVEAADGRIRLKSRANDYSTVVSDDLVWVEGNLRVEGDLRLFNHKLDFRDRSGLDNNGIPLSIQRVDVPGVSGSLQAIIGNADQGANTFMVGPLDSGNNFAAKLTVRDDGKVGIGTTTPRNPVGIQAIGSSEELMSFEDPAGTTKWHINQNLGGNNAGLNFAETGVADGRLFIKTGGNVGIGTTTPRNPMGIRATDLSEELMSFEDPAGTTKWHINQNLEGNKAGLNFVETGVADGRLFIKAGGNIGIGTTSPELKLDIQGDFGRSNGPATLSLFGSRIGDIGTGILFLRSGGDVVAFDGNDRIGIGTSSPQSSLDVVGDVHVAGKVFADGFSQNPSDRSLKKDITSLTGALHKLLQLHGVNFRWIEPEKVGNQSGPQIGLIAQEVEKVFPDWVTIAPNGYKALTIRGFEALTVESLRELHTAVKELKIRIDRLAKNQPSVDTGPRTRRSRKETTHEKRD